MYLPFQDKLNNITSTFQKRFVLAVSVHGWHLQTVRGIVSNLPGNEVSFILMIDFVYLDFVLFHHKNR